MKKFLLLVTGLSFLTAKAQDIPARIDSFFKIMHEAGGFNGNVLIASHDTVIYKGSFGLAEIATGRKLNDSSVFELASVSKQFTAMGIVLLERAGKLSYTDSLRHFFPQLPYNNITVEHLLYHTSGLPDYMTLMKEKTERGSITFNEDLIRLLAQYKPPVNFKPGEKWEYSNTGYALLASIIEKVSGKTFGEYLKAKIFKPLGMRHTEVYRRRFENRKVKNYAYGYVKSDSLKNMILPDEHPNYADMVRRLDGIVGDGTVNSTTGDLLKWSLALDKNLLVPASVKERIFRVGKLNDGDITNYAYGWMTDSLSGIGPVVNHGGSWPGYNTWIEKHFSTGKTVILLNNYGNMQIEYNTLLNLIYNIKGKEKMTTPVDSALLKQYEGVYQLVPEFSITINAKGDRIFAQATGQGEFEIFPEKEDLFFYKVVEAQLKFVRNEKKEIVSLILIQNRREMEGKKIK